MKVRQLTSLAVLSATLLLATSASACPYADKRAELAAAEPVESLPEVLADESQLPAWWMRRALSQDASRGETVQVPN